MNIPRKYVYGGIILSAVVVVVGLEFLVKPVPPAPELIYYKDATYQIAGESITLTGGYHESVPVGEGTSKTITRYFGNELFTDLDGDGDQDVAFIITQETGGSGTFYYAVAALQNELGFVGSDGYLLGDRIAPQSTNLSPNPRHKYVVVFNYADRAPEEPMTTQPSIGKSAYLKIVPETMQWGIVEPDFEGEAVTSSIEQESTKANNEGGAGMSLTTEALIPVVAADFSEDYTKNLVSVANYNLLVENESHLKEIIRENDPEFSGLNRTQNLDDLFKILYVDNQAGIILYIFTSSGDYCGVYSEETGDSLCDSGKLKIFNIKNLSTKVLTENVAGKMKSKSNIYVNKNDNTVIVYGNSSYEVFDLLEPYNLRASTPSGANTLLLNEFAISYTSSTSILTIENLLDEKKVICLVTDESVARTLNDRLDGESVSISPNGKKIVFFTNPNKFVWADISIFWQSTNSNCSLSLNQAELKDVGQSTLAGKWYGESQYLAYSQFGGDVYIYDFKTNKQIFYMQWNGPANVGYLNNYGYIDSVDIDGPVSRAAVVLGEKKVALYFYMENGETHLINEYYDERITQEFSDSVQKYPYNSLGIFTSGKISRDGAPQKWFRIEKDTLEPNLYRVLVLEHYNITHAINVRVENQIPQ